MPAGARPRTPREERIPLVNNSQVWPHWLQIFGRRQPALGELFSSIRKETKPVRAQFERPAEFVWRRVPPTPTEGSGTADRQQFLSSYEPPALYRLQSPESAPVPPSFEQQAVPQAANLDPRVLDRLTDYVIRRVEQRVRIERERRGL